MRAAELGAQRICEGLYPAHSSVLLSSVSLMLRKGFHDLKMLTPMFEFAANLSAWEKHCRKNSMEKRILRAVLLALPGGLFDNEDDMPFLKGREGGRNAKRDLDCFELGRPVQQARRSVARFNRRATDAAMKFSISPACVSIIPWAAKVISVDGQEEMVLKICRKQSLLRSHSIRQK